MLTSPTDISDHFGAIALAGGEVRFDQDQDNCGTIPVAE
jgi:hypothetical protein